MKAFFKFWLRGWLIVLSLVLIVTLIAVTYDYAGKCFGDWGRIFVCAFWIVTVVSIPFTIDSYSRS